MSKEKNKNTFRIGALLLVACLISSVMLSGTFAKYTSEYAGQDTALVARWSFTSASLNNTQNFDLDIFGHEYDQHINQLDTDYIIAPGISGDFVLDMNYIADVDADVEITFAPLDTNTASPPIEYSADGGTTWVALGGLAEEYIEQILDPGVITDPDGGDGTFRIAKVANSSTDDVNISQAILWRWPYEASTAVHAGSSNVADTALGVASNNADLTRTSYGIKVTLTATQVAPGTTTPPGGEGSGGEE
jgi:hypothetical protein